GDDGGDALWGELQAELGPSLVVGVEEQDARVEGGAQVDPDPGAEGEVAVQAPDEGGGVGVVLRLAGVGEEVGARPGGDDEGVVAVGVPLSGLVEPAERRG